MEGILYGVRASLTGSLIGLYGGGVPERLFDFSLYHILTHRLDRE